jgi:hypothetical protein
LFVLEAIACNTLFIYVPNLGWRLATVSQFTGNHSRMSDCP